MLSDALHDGRQGIDRYLTRPEWADTYDAKTRARAGAISATMEALRGYLDTPPGTSDAWEAAIGGDVRMLEQKITEMEQAWRAASPPNLDFSPSEFRAWALAAVRILRAVDEHLVPLLPDLPPLAPERDA